MKIFLFSYGTLQLEKVQIESFGRLLKGKKDKLFGYKISYLKIKDEMVLKRSQEEKHPIAIKSNNESDFISGMVFEITNKELKMADEYEVEDYIRVNETLESGIEAWVYVKNDNK
ncbi:MAG: gamma-glutamylcyclotransferase [Algicola sp.]|nr:gamma-glutamylcyclotransferase [Algicola sp.]